MVLKACLKGFAACWAIVCCPVVVLWYPGGMHVFGCFRHGYIWFLGVVCRFVGVILGGVCAG